LLTLAVFTTFVSERQLFRSHLVLKKLNSEGMNLIAIHVVSRGNKNFSLSNY